MKTQRFQVNDEVRCIDQKDWARYLILNKVYTVLETQRNASGEYVIFVREKNDNWWVNQDSFEFATPGDGWNSP